MPNTQSTAETEFLGQSDAFLEFMEALSAAARVDRPVLLVGERGTGKELAAGRLHYLSERWQRPFGTVNCAALSPALIESELFGHETGAYTGAGARRPGRFEAAQGGTLFLDEISTMPLPAQEKILRVVEYGQLERVGGTQTVQVDVRVIGATNEDLPTLAEEGRFKRDLLDRLSFEVLTLPPLRARVGDPELLAEHFAGQMAIELGLTEAPALSAQAVKTLTTYPWPGNVRELKNAVERSVYRHPGPVLTDIVLDPFASPWRPLPPGPNQREKIGVSTQGPQIPQTSRQITNIKDAVHDVELTLLTQALTHTNHNQGRAAKALGLTYNQFRGLYRKYQKELQE